ARRSLGYSNRSVVAVTSIRTRPLPLCSYGSNRRYPHLLGGLSKSAVSFRRASQAGVSTRRRGPPSPLCLVQFVELRGSAQRSVHEYLCSRTEAASICMVRYLYGSQNEVRTGVASFRDEFGAMALA